MQVRLVTFLWEELFREKVPPTPSSKSFPKRKLFDSAIGRACAPPRSFTDGICQLVHHFSTRTTGSLGCRKLAGTAETLLAQKVVLCEVGARFLGGTFEKVPPITPSKLSKRKFWESLCAAAEFH